jgi:hypothetical protein
MEDKLSDDAGLERPEGDGCMPLFDLVWWIASQGGKIDLKYSVHRARRSRRSPSKLREEVSKKLANSPPSKRWDEAELAIVKALDQNLLSFFGLKGGSDPIERIPSNQLSKLSTHRRSDEKCLICIATPGDSDHYQYQIFGTGMREPSWTNIMASKEDARRLWPFNLPQQTNLVGYWKSKPGVKLTRSETAVLDAVTNLWADGQLDPKGPSRLRHINDYLKNKHKSQVALRTVQRTLEKIRFG